MLQASFNYERMQAAGWEWMILPGLEKIHTNKDDLATSMGHNLEFVNTHPFLVTLVAGIVLSLEQSKADINTIRAVKVACAGPLGGIGDALFWFTLVPITAGITANIAISGSILGPILYFLILFGAQMALRIWLMQSGYGGCCDADRACDGVHACGIDARCICRRCAHLQLRCDFSGNGHPQR